MAEFPTLILAQLAGAVIRCAPLVMFDFLSGPIRLWSGFGDVVAGGFTWRGIGNLGTIPQVSIGQAGGVDEMTFQLFGEAGLLDSINEDAEETSGREVSVYLQFFDLRQFDEDGNAVDWHALEDPISLFWGIMGPPSVSRTAPSDDQSATRSIAVTASNAFINRSRPRFSFFSDRDQKSRDPSGTDNIFSRTSQYSEGTVRWPQF